MNPSLNKKLSFFLVIQLILLKVLAYFPEFITKYYSNGISPYISSFERFLFGKIPFSFGDTLYIFIIIFLSYQLYKNFKQKTVFRLNTLFNFTAYLSIILFIFQLFWGLNYLRTPLYKTLALDKKDVTKTELISFTNSLIQQINTLQNTITHNDTIPVKIPYSFDTVFNKSTNGYQAIKPLFSGINTTAISIKKSMLSLPQIYLGFTGYLNPFTGEAQVNYLIPKLNLPATTCHEMAHQMGYASETEANFIGYMASTHNSDLYFQYSGYFMALRYALNEIHYKYPDDFEGIYKSINKGIIKNQEGIIAYYKKYQSPFAAHSRDLYGFYLKVNNQEKGINSYKYMVYLLVKYDKNLRL